MKITYEFDTMDENFDSSELEMHRQALSMYVALMRIQDKLRDWLKYDSCPVIDEWSHFWGDLTEDEQKHYKEKKHYDLDKMSEEIYEIIDDAGVNMSKMG